MGFRLAPGPDGVDRVEALGRRLWCAFGRHGGAFGRFGCVFRRPGCVFGQLACALRRLACVPRGLACAVRRLVRAGRRLERAVRGTRCAPLLAAASLITATACESGVPVGTIVVLETIPHDSTAYTQGLVFHEGVLYESTGRYGSSTVRRVDPATGEVLASTPLPEAYFGEGLAVVGDRLVQLTWQENVVLLHDRESLALEDSVSVEGRGWGLCWDGEVLFMTSGGSILTKRDPSSLESLGDVQVVRDGVPLWEVNELECVGDAIYANVYQSDTIVRIDKATGEVTAEFDAAGLVPARFRGSPDAVLNGIAYDPGSDTFYLTGKLWPVMYRVRLVDP